MSTPPPPHEPQPPGYQYPAPGGGGPAGPPAPPNPYGQPPTDPYAQPDPHAQPGSFGQPVSTMGDSPYLPGGAPKARRGMRGWQAALLATGTGAAGLVIGLVIGGSGEGEQSDPVAGPTSDTTISTPAAASDVDDDDNTDRDPEPAATTAPAADDDTPDGDEGSRSNPFAIGTPVSDGEWDVVLGEPREAWDDIQQENQFNDPPAEGMAYYLVPVTATYVGEDTGLPWMDLTIQFVGNDARTYTDRCGVIPDDLMDVSELYEGGVGEGNVCVAVPEGADGLWTLRTGWQDNTVFFDTTD